MLDHMLNENTKLKEDFHDKGIKDEDRGEKNLTFIKEMIYGPLDESKRDAPDKDKVTSIGLDFLKKNMFTFS